MAGIPYYWENAICWDGGGNTLSLFEESWQRSQFRKYFIKSNNHFENTDHIIIIKKYYKVPCIIYDLIAIYGTTMGSRNTAHIEMFIVIQW